ncbi:MAG: VTT domain-containing protein [Verrucomicrobia bacterium]|nr:VTT domain-containing protein [Verrucomicrobiota bacterium]MCH8514634.1 hypothetical protein [Kiritimatiellia bacterium]
MKKIHSNWKRFFKIIAVLMFLGGLYAIGRQIDQEALRAWKETAPPHLFFGALTFLPLIGLPTTPFFMVAGATYGIAVALVGTAIALAANLMLSWWITASGLRPVVEKILAKTKHKLPNIGNDRGVRFTILVRMVPAMPNFVKNYLLCLAGVSLPIYFSLSMAISFTYAVPFILLGESVFDQDVSTLVIAVSVLVLLSVGAHFLSRKFNPKNEAEESDENSKPAI